MRNSQLLSQETDFIVKFYQMRKDVTSSEIYTEIRQMRRRREKILEQRRDVDSMRKAPAERRGTVTDFAFSHQPAKLLKKKKTSRIANSSCHSAKCLNH